MSRPSLRMSINPPIYSSSLFIVRAELPKRTELGYFGRMKYYAALVGLILAITTPLARAQQGPDDQYIAIYNLMQQADSLVASGQPRDALADYTQARAELDKFAKVFPNWNSTIVTFRLNYLAQKINGLTAQLPATNTPPPTAVEPAPGVAPPDAALQAQLGALQEQVRDLQAGNQTLQAKLKEALSAQPAGVDIADLAKARAQVLSLMKQYDLLRAESAQPKTGGAGAAESAALKKAQQALADANQKLAEQTKRADKLAKDNQALQTDHNSVEALRAENALLKKQAAGATARAAESDALKKAQQALTDANQKLAEQTKRADKLEQDNTALQARLQTPPAGSDSLEALRAENALLKKQAADAKPGATDAEAGLAKAQAQIAALQSTADILRLEKAALESRIQQLQPGKGNAAPPSTGAKTPATSRGPVWSCPKPGLSHFPRRCGNARQCQHGDKSVSGLPSGSADLVAEAQNYFSSGQSTRPRRITGRFWRATRTTRWCWQIWRPSRRRKTSLPTRRRTSRPRSRKARTTPTTFPLTVTWNSGSRNTTRPLAP